MSNNKQSSVEWLVSQLKISTYWNTLIAELEFMDLEIDDIIEKAKAMHKEEVTEAFYIGRYEYNNFDSSSTEYYNETYGGNK